jgi:hypothetical protein
MTKKLDGTFLKDFSQRELALTLFAAFRYISDNNNITDIQDKIKTDDIELEDLRQKLSEFFENI